EPDNSLSMGDEHLDTIPATESDQFIKSGVENLIPIPSESEGIPEHVCDVPSHANSPPLDSELVSSEVMEIVIPEVDAFLSVDDESTSSQFPKSNLDPEGDILLFEAFLNDDHSSDSQTKSSSTSLNSLLEETHIFHNSLPGFTTFSNVLFDADYDSDSSDDQSLSDEDVSKKIYSNPFFDEEIIPMEIDPHSFNAESDLIESMPNNDSSIIIPSKIDSLFDEFAGELTLLKSFPSGIDKPDCHPEKEIRFTKRLLYDNSSPRPPEEFVSDNSNADIKSFSPSPILIKDSDSYMEEIDLSLNPSLEYIPDDDQWKEHSSLGCSLFPFLPPLIRSSMGEFGPAHLTLNKRFVEGTPCLSF
nr:hypothetical protein [Tanacetum cinerariifolium]